MLGANHYGRTYYGEGAGTPIVFVLRTVEATATTSATLTTVLLITYAISATVNTTASITRQIQRSLSATAVTVGSVMTVIVEALSIRKATTKFLGLMRGSRTIEMKRQTLSLDPPKTGKLLTED